MNKQQYLGSRVDPCANEPRVRGGGWTSHNGTTGSDSQLVGYAAELEIHTSQSHMRRSRS